MRNPLSKKVIGIKPSGIRKFFDVVQDMPEAISLGVGEPDFDTPWHVREEGIYALEQGKEVLAQLKENKVVLEFQISSNVRLNNLNSLKDHPLKQYLKQGIWCVQGTDGAALYGTSSIDEELSLKTMLGLTDAELKLMKDAETEIIKFSQDAYSQKKEAFNRLLKGRDMEEVLLEKMQRVKISGGLSGGEERLDANREFKDRISDITWDRFPVVLLGGSFNTENRATRITEAGKKELIKKLVSLDTPPSEPVIQALMRIIKKPSIPEASQGVFDDTVDYLKSICRY